MPRRLITCPVCKTDQHIYRNKLARHQGENILTCDGSGWQVVLDKVLTPEESFEARAFAAVYGPDVGKNKFTTPPPPVVPIDCRAALEDDNLLYLCREDVVRLIREAIENKRFLTESGCDPFADISALADKFERLAL